MSRVILGIGSNMGNRGERLLTAVTALQTLLADMVVSPVYETAPWGVVGQRAFYNLCVAGETDLEPLALLHQLKQLEATLGRKPSVRWGPRQIDIDIISYNQLVLTSEALLIPHPRLAERAFVLAPLADIEPDFLHPATGESVGSMLERVGRAEVRRLTATLSQLSNGGRLAKIGRWVLGEQTLVMGILNVTPDSFSGDGLLAEGDVVSRAVRQAVEFVEQGAHIVDIGAESTRPGSTPVSAEEEMRRALPVLSAVRQAVDVPVSIDTYRAGVARAALDAGADMVNDVWALRMDPEMAAVVSSSDVPVVLMHNRFEPQNEEQARRLAGGFGKPATDDIVTLVKSELGHSISLAHQAGIADSKIIIDPGIGFGKTLVQNLQLVDRLASLKVMGYPVLIGPSRKSFIGRVLELPEEERVEGTAAVIALAVDRGADIVRVHDVRVMARVARMVDSIVRARG